MHRTVKMLSIFLPRQKNSIGFLLGLVLLVGQI